MNRLRGLLTVALCVGCAVICLAGCTNGGPEPGPRPILPVRMAEGRNQHTAGPWKYVVLVKGAGTRSVTHGGHLWRQGNVIVGARRGQVMRTPWGLLRWHGPVPHPFRLGPPYSSGWLPA